MMQIFDGDKRLKELLTIFHKLRKLMFNLKFSHVNGGEIPLLFFIEHAQHCHGNTKITPNEIAKHLHVSTARVASILNVLEKKKMISRTNSKTDKRKVYVMITKNGVKELQKKMIGFQQKITDILDKVPKKDIDNLICILNKIVNVAISVTPPNHNVHSFKHKNIYLKGEQNV